MNGFEDEGADCEVGEAEWEAERAAEAESAVDRGAPEGVEFLDGSAVPLSYVDRMMGMVEAALAGPRGTR